MPISTYWTIYKWFHDPPGAPKDLKCIGCKLAVCGASYTLMGASIYGLKKTMWNNAYKGMVFGFVAFAFFTTGSVALRVAIEDDKWNKLHIKASAEELRRLRKENSGLSNPQLQPT